MNLVNNPLDLGTIKIAVVDCFDQYQSTLQETPLSTAMAYTLKPKSKLFRPTIIACLAQNHLSSVLTQRAMLAIELIHTYSLIHDDLPAMDNDDLRRGQKSCHLAFDESTAILAGDALLTEAFELLSDPVLDQPQAQLRLCHTLAHASGRMGMALGQWQDLHPQEPLDLNAIEAMYALKTGKLIEAAFTMGIIVGGIQSSHSIQILQQVSQALGIAFQIRDDLLDLEPEEVSGKPQHSDAAQNRKTYLAIMGKNHAQTKLSALKNTMISQLHTLPEATEALESLIVETLS